MRQKTQSMQQFVLPELEDRLRKKSESIADFYDPTHNESKIAFTKSSLLHGVISKKKVKQERELRLLALDKANTERAFWEYFKLLAKTLDLTVEMLREYRIKQQYECDQIACKWLQERCKTMVLKLRVLKNQFLCDTYTPETVSALKKVKNQLELAKRDAVQEHERVLVKLQEYSSIGMGFDAIVKQYTGLLEEMKNKQWALNELQKNKA
eukprot:TRINITY_DN1145_c0_g1_i1.p2 TRINITY_DN1145_c0_g1~~TRINITY_DN1145_c0_g1_i1.p2  ORF type:complete len:210 (-),score=63.16 TRINITY_DN1145_c0_g1_i1:62-691(-)